MKKEIAQTFNHNTFMFIWEGVTVVFGVVLIMRELNKINFPYNDLISVFLAVGLVIWNWTRAKESEVKPLEAKKNGKNE